MFKSQEPASKIQQSWLINILLKLDIYFLVLQLHLGYIFKFSSSKYFLISSMPHLPCLGFTCWDHVSAPQQCDPAQGTVGPRMRHPLSLQNHNYCSQRFLHICQCRPCTRIFFRRSFSCHHLTWAFHTGLPSASQGMAGNASGLARWPLLQDWEYLGDGFSVNSMFLSSVSNHPCQRLLFSLFDSSIQLI